MNYKQKGDGIEGRHCCPTLPTLTNEGWDPGWPWDLMLDPGWLEGDMSLLGWVGRAAVLSMMIRLVCKSAQCEQTSCGPYWVFSM